MKNKLYFIIILLLFISCSSIMNDFVKNEKFTKTMISKLLKENGNVFYIFPNSYSNYSFVWVYKDNAIKIFKLQNGKVFKEETFSNKGINTFNIPSKKDLLNEIFNECGMVNYDAFGFKLKNNENDMFFEIATEVSCIKSKTYNSIFLNKIVEDIKFYKIYPDR